MGGAAQWQRGAVIWAALTSAWLVCVSAGETSQPKNWQMVLPDVAASQMAAQGGCLYAATDHGLFVKQFFDTEGSFDKFFGTAPVENVWMPPVDFTDEGIAEGATSAVEAFTKLSNATTKFVIANGTLYTSALTDTSELTWKPVFAEGHPFAGRTVLDVHGNKDKIALLLKSAARKQRKGDTIGERTTRGDLYVSPTSGAGSLFSDSSSQSAVASFPATAVRADSGAGLYTYGDIYGPHGAFVGVSRDNGDTWRHHQPQTAGQNGKIFVHNDIVVVTSDVGNVLKSVGGYHFELLTPTANGLPKARYSAAVVDGQLVVVGTADSGVYASTSGGERFEMHAAAGHKAFPSNKVLSLAFDRVTGDLYAGTDKGIVLKQRAHESEQRKKEELSWWQKLYTSQMYTF